MRLTGRRAVRSVSEKCYNKNMGASLEVMGDSSLCKSCLSYVLME